MCGIFFYHCGNIDLNIEEDLPCKDFMKSNARGPDNTHVYVEDKMIFGFHRLAINDLSPAGNQPMQFDDIILICNGEIYNHKELNEKYNLTCTSRSDCETIARLYMKLRDDNCDYYDDILIKLCQELDGEFAFIIYDKKINKLIVARDPYGMRPLFVGYDEIAKTIAFGSELKYLDKLFNNVHQVRPSKIFTYDLDKSVFPITYEYNHIYIQYDPDNVNLDVILPEIKTRLENSVRKRLIGDVPACALLSGGLDSSLVCAIMAREMRRNGNTEPLHTFSIGLADAPDLRYARMVSEHIGSVHHEVIVTEKEMLDAIPDVIKAIESFDVTTVRASVPNYLIAKHIAKHTNFKIVLSGEMSDELFNGYLYSRKAPSPDALHEDSCRLLNEITYFDSLRADRCITAHGLEARIPFSDKYLVKYVQSINPTLKMSDTRIEKWLLRASFDDGSNLLPKEVLFRIKAAFSDSVSKKEKSWYMVIQEHISSDIDYNNITSDDKRYNDTIFAHCKALTDEGYWMQRMFHVYYRNVEVIPHYWLPRWCGDVTDPSARILAGVYEEN